MALPPRGVFEIRSTDADHVIAVYNPLLLAYFARPPEDHELALLSALANEAGTQGIKGGMLFVVARRNAAGGIQPRVREFFERMVRENSSRSGASAAVVLMKGFGASLMRSFLTSLLVLSGRRKSFQIFGAIDPACRWLAPLHDLDASTLLQVLERVTANLAP